MPTRRPPGAGSGTGWLLGLHAPAGASWGRFVHALGTPLADACAEIADAERRRLPGEERVDVGVRPQRGARRSLRPSADPSARAGAVGLERGRRRSRPARSRARGRSRRPAGAGAARAASAGRDATAQTIVPSPLLRARSATAAPGVARLLVGWSLQRQHAPWAFTPGPLAELAFLPRLIVDGFVIAPASWRLPAELRQAGHRPRPGALARWRREAGVPRMVQVGEGDELYPVDLQARRRRRRSGRARAGVRDLAAARRRPSIATGAAWRRSSRSSPRSRHRRRRRARAPAASPRPARSRRCPAGAPSSCSARPRARTPCSSRPSFRRWPRRARAGEIDAWFFLRYLDGPGERPHLRLRVRGRDGGEPAAFERRLRRALRRRAPPARSRRSRPATSFPSAGGSTPAISAPFTRSSRPTARRWPRSSPPTRSSTGSPRCRRSSTRWRAGWGWISPRATRSSRGRRNAADAWTRLDGEARRESDAGFRRHARPLRAALTAPPPLADPLRGTRRRGRPRSDGNRARAASYRHCRHCCISPPCVWSVPIPRPNGSAIPSGSGRSKGCANRNDPTVDSETGRAGRHRGRPPAPAPGRLGDDARGAAARRTRARRAPPPIRRPLS